MTPESQFSKRLEQGHFELHIRVQHVQIRGKALKKKFFSCGCHGNAAILNSAGTKMPIFKELFGSQIPTDWLQTWYICSLDQYEKSYGAFC